MNASWWQSFARRCPGGHPHASLVGGTNIRKAAEYPKQLCAERAKVVAEQRNQCGDFPPEEAVEDPRAVETP